MTPAEVKGMSNVQILEMLTTLRPSDSAVAFLAALISDPAAVEGVAELRRRYSPEPEFPLTRTGRMQHASTVFIDRQRWNAFFFKRRIPLNQVGSLMEPERCDGWASVCGSKGRVGFNAMDELAIALDMRVDDLIWEVGTDAERERLGACV